MAKSKNKKSNQPNISPENYIKTRVRSLPIGKCFINRNWEDAGNCSVVVSRNHSNGNFTFGLFLVDLFCLGVKESLYFFNEYSKFNEIIDDMKQNEEMVEIEYPLAHNIIYGGVEYADSLGFKPHKSFEVSKYLLEEDDDRVELIDIEFGYKGQPAIFVGKEKHPHNIIATLERTMGKGNFLVVTGDDFEEDDDEVYYDEDEEFEEDDDEPLSEEAISAILDGNKKTSTRKMTRITFAMYEDTCTEKEQAEMRKIMNEVDSWEIVDEVEMDDPVFLNQENELKYGLLYDKVIQDPGKALPEIESLIAEHPGEYHFQNLLSVAYDALHDTKKETENIVSTYAKFPHKILAFTNYLIKQIESDNVVELKKLIGDEFDFHKTFPDRNNLSFEEFLSLTGALFLYFSQKGTLHKGIAYVMPLCEFIFYDENKLKAKQTLMLVSKLMLEEIGRRKGFDDEIGEEIDEV